MVEESGAAKPEELTDAGHAEKIRKAIRYLQQAVEDAKATGLEVGLITTAYVFNSEYPDKDQVVVINNIEVGIRRSL